MLRKSVGKKKRTKLEDKTARELVKHADTWWSRYVRLRDSKPKGNKRIGVCISCNRTLTVMEDGKWARGQCGHFVTRGIMTLRFDEENTHLQCEHCNAWRDKADMTNAYEQAVDDWHGPGTANKLLKASKQEGAYKIPPKQDLLNLIEECKAYVKERLDG